MEPKYLFADSDSFSWESVDVAPATSCQPKAVADLSEQPRSGHKDSLSLHTPPQLLRRAPTSPPTSFPVV